MSGLGEEEENTRPPPPIHRESAYHELADEQRPSTAVAPAEASDGAPLPAAGNAPIQLYSLATPNGQKVGVMLEELRRSDAPLDFDAHTIAISGAQFSSGFLKLNPNAKIPVIVDREGPGGQPVTVFESGHILLHLAEKTGCFLPSDDARRAECLDWLHWQMASLGPILGNFGHYFSYTGASGKRVGPPPEATAAAEFGVERFGHEATRLLHTLETHLSDGRDFIVAGTEFTIADMAIMPWVHFVDSGHDAWTFLSADRLPHLNRWLAACLARPGVQAGLDVCKPLPMRVRHRMQGVRRWLRADGDGGDDDSQRLAAPDRPPAPLTPPPQGGAFIPGLPDILAGLPEDPAQRAACLNWLFWQCSGVAPYFKE
jgi:GST-like protein